MEKLGGGPLPPDRSQSRPQIHRPGQRIRLLATGSGLLAAVDVSPVDMVGRPMLPASTKSTRVYGGASHARACGVRESQIEGEGVLERPACAVEDH